MDELMAQDISIADPIAENKSSQETSADSELTGNKLDPLEYFSRFLNIPEMILNHLGGGDLIKISEVSPLWYSTIASSKELMKNIKVVFNVKRELQQGDYVLLKNSSRMYQNIEIRRRYLRGED